MTLHVIAGIRRSMSASHRSSPRELPLCICDSTFGHYVGRGSRAAESRVVQDFHRDYRVVYHNGSSVLLSEQLRKLALEAPFQPQEDSVIYFVPMRLSVAAAEYPVHDQAQSAMFLQPHPFKICAVECILSLESEYKSIAHKVDDPSGKFYLASKRKYHLRPPACRWVMDHYLRKLRSCDILFCVGWNVSESDASREFEEQLILMYRLLRIPVKETVRSLRTGCHVSDIKMPSGQVSWNNQVTPAKPPEQKFTLWLGSFRPIKENDAKLDRNFRVQPRMHPRKKGLYHNTLICSFRQDGEKLYTATYVGHGNSKSAYLLNFAGGKYHGGILKLDEQPNKEARIFMHLSQQGFSPEVLAEGSINGYTENELIGGHAVECWITEYLAPLDWLIEAATCPNEVAEYIIYQVLLVHCGMNERCNFTLSDTGLYNWGYSLRSRKILPIDAGSREPIDSPVKKGTLYTTSVKKFFDHLCKSRLPPEIINCIKDIWINENSESTRGFEKKARDRIEVLQRSRVQYTLDDLVQNVIDEHFGQGSTASIRLDLGTRGISQCCPVVDTPSGQAKLGIKHRDFDACSVSHSGSSSDSPVSREEDPINDVEVSIHSEVDSEESVSVLDPDSCGGLLGLKPDNVSESHESEHDDGEDLWPQQEPSPCVRCEFFLSLCFLKNSSLFFYLFFKRHFSFYFLSHTFCCYPMPFLSRHLFLDVSI